MLDRSGGDHPFVVACLTVALVFAGVGAAAPVTAIKKPLRSYRFLAGIGRSPLSRQAALVGLFLVLLLAHWILVLAGVYALWLGIVTVAIGAAAVLAAGMTYLLGAQPPWRRWSTPVALFGGLLGLGVSTSLVIALGWRDVLLAGTSGGLAGRVLVLAGVAGPGQWPCDARALLRVSTELSAGPMPMPGGPGVAGAAAAASFASCVGDPRSLRRPAGGAVRSMAAFLPDCRPSELEGRGGVVRARTGGREGVMAMTADHTPDARQPCP